MKRDTIAKTITFPIMSSPSKFLKMEPLEADSSSMSLTNGETLETQFLFCVGRKDHERLLHRDKDREE